MRPLRPIRLAALIAALLPLLAALLLAPGVALADGDPASDTLLVQDVFYPYQPTVSANLTTALNKTVSLARAAGYQVKVALIGGPGDLGAVPNLAGQPQRYATFLFTEISFNSKAPLLVVMPQGFGLAGGAGPASVLANIHVDANGGSDALARAAIKAVVALAAHAGHPFTPPPIATGTGGHSGSGGGGTAALAFGVPVAIVIVVAAFALLRRRREGEVEEGSA